MRFPACLRSLVLGVVHSSLVVWIGWVGDVRADEPNFSESALRGASVELYASLSESVPRVTLLWNVGHYPSTGITVYRRPVGNPVWGAGVPLAANATSYADPSAVANTLYEYRVVRTQDSANFPVAEGRLWSGVNAPMDDARGTVILVVDQTMAGPLSVEIDRLIADLVGDGWEVARTDVSRTAPPQQVKDAIHGWYAVDEVAAKAVLLLGHVPVPYSGMVCPDGHYDPPPDPNHRGAWPTDAFYGDMDGVWTDSSVNIDTADVDGTRNRNLPGDGKFDVSLLVGEHLPELVVGRIDLANLPTVADGVPEAELLRRYLDRHHAFRHRLAPFENPGHRAMVDDDLFGPDSGQSFASGGWTSGVALFGNSNTAAGDWVPALRDQDHLLAFGCGPGSFSGAGGVSTITDFRDTRCRAVFNLLFGSFFGDWDSADNYLRSALVGRSDSHGLVSLWAGNPKWQLFPLAAGGTLADAYWHTVFEINQPGGPFPPTDDSWTNPDQAHIAIMGDPVLRSHPVKPVTGLGANVAGNQVTLTWMNPSGESDLLGCRIYRSSQVFGPYSVVGAAPTGSTSFVDTVPSGGTWHYLVRVVKRQTTPSAIYENPAQGIRAEISVPGFGYATWSAGLSDATEGGDPNLDGIPNLLAYAIGSEDGNRSATDLLPGTTQGRAFSVPFSDRVDVFYFLQLSPDLATWFTIATRSMGGAWTLNAGSGYPGQGQVSMYGAGTKTFVDASSSLRRFWRLKASR